MVMVTNEPRCDYWGRESGIAGRSVTRERQRGREPAQAAANARGERAAGRVDGLTRGMDYWGWKRWRFGQTDKRWRIRDGERGEQREGDFITWLSHAESDAFTASLTKTHTLVN